MNMTTVDSVSPLCKQPMQLLGPHPDFGLSVFRCVSCDFAHTPDMSEKALAAYYQATYTEQSGREILSEPYQAWQLERAREQVKFLQSHLDLRSVNTAVDIGCGIGMSARALGEAKNDIRWLGIELDEACQDYLYRNGLQVVANYQDVQDTFDFVFSSHSLEHFVHPSIFFEMSIRLANASGYLFLEVPNESNFSVKQQVKLKRSGRAHISFYSRQSLLQVTQMYGWKCLALRHCAAGDRYSVYSYFRQESLWVRVARRLRLLRPYWRLRDSLLRTLYPESGVAMRAVFVRELTSQQTNQISLKNQ